MSDNNAITVSDTSDSFSQVLQQYVYLVSEDSTEFYIKSLDSLNLVMGLDKSLLIISILVQSGYLPSDSYVYSFDLNTSFESTFYFFLNKKMNLRVHDVFNSQFIRAQSGQWSYVVR